MNFLILGPVEIRNLGEVAELLPRRQRVVLSVLLLNADTVVSLDQLVDATWDNDAPRTARSQVQVCVSKLRQLLARMGLHDVISTRPPGYMLRLTDGQSDLREFERLAGNGDEAIKDKKFQEGTALLRSALELWRGEAFAGAESRTLESAATHLRERRLAVLESRIEADLSLGRHRELIGELHSLISQYPFRERFRGQLMLALYRSGRQSDALDQYQQARALFAEELALEPGPMLRELERSILVNEPGLDVDAPDAAYPNDSAGEAPVLVPRLLPAAIGDFTGRSELLALLEQRLRHTDSGRFTMPLEVITGTGGVGKTTFAIQLAQRLSDDYFDGQLFANLSDVDPRSWAPAQVLGTFLRSLGVAGREIPEDVNAMAAMYRDRLAGRRVLVVLDNVTSEDQVLHLLPGSSTCATLVTSRVHLTGLPGARHVTLDAFTESQSLRFITKMLSDDERQLDAAALHSLAQLCDGLPLALRIAGARLAARPHWPVTQLRLRMQDENRRLNELNHGSLSIRANIALSYDRLPEPARPLLRRLALSEAADFEPWVAACLLDRPLAEAIDVLDALVDTHLVEVEHRPGWPPRLRLHDLIRAFARERLDAEEPAAERDGALRRLFGGWLHLAEEAHRAEYGGSHPVLTGDATRWQLSNADTVAVLGRPLDWFERERHALAAAVRQAASIGFDDLSWQLAIPLITLYESRGGFDEWLLSHQAALDVTVRSGNRLGEAAMRYSIGAMYVHKQDYTRAREWFEDAFDAFAEIGHMHGSALTLRYQAHLARVAGQFDVAVREYEEALRRLRAIGDRVSESYVLTSVAQIHLSNGELNQAAALTEEALFIAEALDNDRLRAQAYHRLGEVALARERNDEAVEHFTMVLATVRRTGDQMGEAFALHGIGLVHLARGEDELAQDTLTTALSHARSCSQRVLTARIRLVLADVQTRSGHAERATWELATALRTFVQVGAAPHQLTVLRKLREIWQTGCGEAVRDAMVRALTSISPITSPEVRETAGKLRTELR